MPNQKQATLAWYYYVLLASESFLLAIAILYLVISRGCKKTRKEVFYNKDKIVIVILASILLTIGLTYLEKELVFLSTNEKMQPTMNNNSSVNYSAKEEINTDSTIQNKSYESSNSDENVILVDGENHVEISNTTLTKSGDSDGGDTSSFYGNNAALLAKGGANVTIKDTTVETNATGANGVFSFGGSATTNNTSNDGTTINISDSTITTKKDNSGGIMATGGGIIKASNLTVYTSGVSSAAIRSDRGGGTITVDGGTYETAGAGSPMIYSTADISVSHVTLCATAAEGVVIEGKNSVSLDDVTLTDTNQKLNGKSTTYKNIFLYQSMSGDASNGTSSFTAKNSTITTNKGDTFYVTNTPAKIVLENNTIINQDTTGNFLRIQKDSWGNSGSNGGNVVLEMTKQKATGNIVVDSISTLEMSLKDSSSFEGSINQENQAKSIQLSLDKTSKIKLTADSYVTSFTNEDTTNQNIDFNGYHLYVNGKAIS